MVVPIHGLDYLNDHYAILGVDRTATQDEIRSAFTKGIRENHPDIVDRASDAIKSEARKKTELYTLAYQTLSDEGLREKYNEQLAEFDPALVSPNGVPRIDITRKRVDIDLLVSGNKREGREELQKKIDGMTGYNPAALSAIEQVYLASPNPELASAYKALLEQKLTYLSLMEDQAWAEAGVPNRDKVGILGYPDDHIAARQGQIEEAREEIKMGVEARVLALSSGLAPKLLMAGGENITQQKVQNDTLVLRSKLTEAALDTFEDRKSEIERLASDKVDVMEKLLQFTEWEYVPQSQAPHEKLLIAVASHGKILLEVLYEISHGKANPQIDVEVQGISVEDYKASSERLQNFASKGINTSVMHTNPELDFIMESMYVLTQHSEND